MMDPLQAERLKTADALVAACAAVAELEKLLPECTNAAETAQVTRALDDMKAEVRRHGERMLQLEVARSAAPTRAS